MVLESISAIVGKISLAYYAFLTSLLGPIMVYPLFLIEMVMTIVVMLVLTLLSKRLVNQEQIRALKSEHKNLMAKHKELMKTDPKQASGLTNEMLKISNKQMLMNMKASMVTLIVVVAVLPWLGYITTVPTSSFKVAQESVFLANFTDNVFHKGSETVYFQINNFTKGGEQDCSLFSCSPRYNYTFSLSKDGDNNFELQNLKVGDNISIINKWVIGGVRNDTLSLGAIAVNLPFYFPGFGYRFGWLMWYIVLSLPFSFLFRKILGVEQ